MLTEQGYKAIEAVVLGELLWSKNTDTDEQAWKPVTRIFREPNRGIYDLVLKSEQGDIQHIETTDDHPFYAAVIDQHRVDLTYNFTIADFHTYYVTKHRVLVHNCPNGDGVTKGATDAAKRLGVNLDKISVTNGVGRAKIALSANLNPGDINKLKDVFKARGANKAEIDTGFITNEKLDTFLRR